MLALVAWLCVLTATIVFLLLYFVAGLDPTLLFLGLGLFVASFVLRGVPQVVAAVPRRRRP